MNTETNRTKLKWYQRRRWRWIPPGGYYGGFFAGFGLATMVLAGGLIPSSWDTYVYLGGTAIFMIATLITYSREALHDEDQERRDG